MSSISGNPMPPVRSSHCCWQANWPMADCISEWPTPDSRLIQTITARRSSVIVRWEEAADIVWQPVIGRVEVFFPTTRLRIPERAARSPYSTALSGIGATICLNQQVQLAVAGDGRRLLLRLSARPAIVIRIVTADDWGRRWRRVRQ